MFSQSCCLGFFLPPNIIPMIDVVTIPSLPWAHGTQYKYCGITEERHSECPPLCLGHKCQLTVILSNVTCHLCSSNVWLLLGDFQAMWRYEHYDSFHLICPPMVSVDSSSFLLTHLTYHPHSCLGGRTHLHQALTEPCVRAPEDNRSMGSQQKCLSQFPACQAVTACLLSPELCSHQ